MRLSHVGQDCKGRAITGSAGSQKPRQVRGKIRALEFLDEQLHLPEGAIAS